ncbi:hypothetical protein PENTCL1PPCAC_7946, partial [Pristionchus entomophagus]
TVVLLAAVAASAAASFSFPEAASVRVKRQQCRCVRLVNGGGMQCSCMQPLATNELGTQQGGLASQVSQAAGTPQASCQCIQIFISDAPTYRCLCDPRPATTVGVTIKTTVTQPQTLQPTQPTLPTLPPITTAPTAPPTVSTVPTIPVTQPTPVTQPFSYPTLPSTVPTIPTIPSTLPTFPPITTPPTPVTQPPFTYSTAPPTQTPPIITSPPLITPISTFPPITNPPVTVTLPPVTYPVTVPTVTTVTPLPTPGPSSTTPGYEPPVTQTVPPSQACQCIMIRINGPQNAQYQCSCPGVANPIPVAPGGTGTGVTGAPALPSLNDGTAVNPYPATGVTNGTSAGCFCLDGANPNLGCGCSCDCFSLTVTIPTGVCVCPQDDSGRVVTTPGQPGVSTHSYTNPVTQAPVQPVQPTQPGQSQTLPPITNGPTYGTTYQTPAPLVTQPAVYPTGPGQTLPTQPVQPTQPAVLPPITTSMAPIVQPGHPGVTPAADGSATTTLPLTTTCILYPVTAGSSTPQQQCTCMPQYEQCAQNVCCLSSRFRSQKNDLVRAAADATGVQESTLDMFVDVFNKIKNRFTATA